jgi:hypothetical protein
VAGRARTQEDIMGKCVKCEHQNLTGILACVQCSWPFSVDAWKTSRQQIRRVTLDTSCVNARRRHPDLNTLERWAVQGLLELQRSEAMLRELRGEARREKARQLVHHPDLFTLGSSRLGEDVFPGPDLLGELQQVLFPTAKPLTENQCYDVEHLRLHVRTGGDIFVTLNPNDFITRGRQETLRSFGVWVLSPGELVRLLTEVYGWQQTPTENCDEAHPLAMRWPR